MVSTVPLSTVDPVALAAPAPFAVFPFRQSVLRRVLVPLWTVSFVKVAVPTPWSVRTFLLALLPLSCSVRVRAISHAGSTIASTIATPKGVFLGVRVTVDALGSCSVDRRRPPTACVVHGMSHRFEMTGVHAGALATQVVDGVLRRDRTDKGGVGMPMCQQALFADAEELVALHAANVDLEQPAGGLIPTVSDGDKLPEPLGQTGVAQQCGTIEHIDSTQSVVPRGVDAPAGFLPVILQVEVA